MVLVTENFESGLNNFRISGYGGIGLATSTAYAHHGTRSVIYHTNDSMTRDFTNTNPTADLYYWMYVYFDNPIVNLSFPGGGNSVGILELRNTEANVICFIQASSWDAGATYNFELCSFEMNQPHAIKTKVAVAGVIVPAQAYKLVVGYSHTSTWQILKLWIDDVLKATISESNLFNYTANNIYIGSPKAEYGYGLASGAYLDCLGIGYDYPTADYFTPTPSDPEPEPEDSPPSIIPVRHSIVWHQPLLRNVTRHSLTPESAFG